MLIDEHGTCSWTKVGENIFERTGKQCRERWYNHLDPSVKKGEWTAEVSKCLTRNRSVVPDNHYNSFGYIFVGGHDISNYAEDYRESMG